MADIRPVILGYDAVSPLGTELEGQWDRAAAGESGVGALTRFPAPGGIPRPDRRPGRRGRFRPLSLSQAPRDGPLDLPDLSARPARRPPGLEAGRSGDHPGDGPAGGRHVRHRHRRARRAHRRGPDPDGDGEAPPALHEPQLLHQHGERQGLDPDRGDGPHRLDHHRLRHGEQFADPGGDVHRPGDGRCGDLRGRGLPPGRADRGGIRDDERDVPPQGGGGALSRPGPRAAPSPSTGGGSSFRRGPAAS